MIPYQTSGSGNAWRVDEFVASNMRFNCLDVAIFTFRDGMSMDAMGSVPEAVSTTDNVSPELDYWRFVSLATEQVAHRLDSIDAEPSHLALSLNRASDIITYVTETFVHRPLNLTWSGFRVLFVLWIVGETEQSKLTLLTNSSKATVSNLTNVLVKQGMIERTPSENDRRTFRVSLTPLGENTVTQAYVEQNDLLVQWSSVLDAEERRTLLNLLEKLMHRRDIFESRSTT